MASRTEAFAAAKINLYLHVGERRADGFHELESLVVFANVGDTLSFAAADAFTLVVDGPFAAGLAAEGDNLVLRAARALAAQAGVAAGAAITLTKNLPVASGIGGGSADAAATLRGLTHLWGLARETFELAELAEMLGSDVPVCVASRAAWMEGRGERLTRVRRAPRGDLVLVNPGVAVPTAAVFAGLKSRRGTGALDYPILEGDAWSLAEFLRETNNDLEAPALAIAPAIGEALAALRAQAGVYLARMSGSGATCFALFESAEAAAAAAQAIQAARPAWWVAATQILN
ncbi:MAG TPA: 4-(cytidine 5'-diphospho)-2-C-methyl-D-erythritol kinase [Rhizomicrobium sp.]|nr:4-(cytidine 5'-diphospho)-2-C-methyl-D-erythritol kinase [Rhizomicrobium sp.]